MKRYFEEGEIQCLSMGMTHDFEVALEEGANIVRVGCNFGNVCMIKGSGCLIIDSVKY